MKTPIIEVRGFSKSFGAQKVFDRIDLNFHEGELTFLLGPSGVGKSVLLKHLVGLLRPDEGDLRIFGKAIPYDRPRELNEMRKKVGLLFQGSALFDNMTVFRNVSFPLVNHRKDLSQSEIRTRVFEKLSAVGLDPEQIAEKLPNELSGGMKKRVALARSIALEPRIILYDEPTTGLDPINRETVEEMICDANRRFGLTSVVVSHDITTALRLADRIAFLYGGKIVFLGTPAEIFGSKHLVVRRFLEAEVEHSSEILAATPGAGRGAA